MSGLLRRLWPFPGGVSLPGRKESSTREPILTAPIPAQLVLPLRQHAGEPPEPVVKVGQRVITGELLARPQDSSSVALHAPSSGTVAALEPRPLPHPSGFSELCVVIACDGLDEWAEPAPSLDWRRAEAKDIRARARESGVAGLGGAVFPTHLKLATRVPTLILNAVECEPYISCDEMLLRERTPQVIEGARIMMRALGAAECLIGIEEDRSEAISALAAALSGAADMELVPVPARYPAGGERQLIQTLTGQEVPAGGLPADIGLLCHNIGTAAALYQAVVQGRPLISRIVTVTGAGVASPRNLEARLGTPLRELIAACGGYTAYADRLVMGGPMMGYALPDDRLPLVKAANCILVGSAAELPRPQPALPCIRCGACMEVCPAQLLPQQLYAYSQAGELERARGHGLPDCIECGACAYVCPSHIPLVDYFRHGKSELRRADDERRQAELARERYELRQLRLQREKQEAAARRQRKKEALRRPTAVDAEDAKKAAIAAAIARARQKKAARADHQDDEA